MRLEEFCHEVARIVAHSGEEATPAAGIAGLLPALLAAGDLLTPAQKSAPESGYGRHEVFLCPDDTFSVIAAVWPAGFASPIHDHMTWCAFGVFEGVVRESRYRTPTAGSAPDEAIEVACTDWEPGQATWLPDGGDIHCMYNPTDLPAVSVHVYGGNAAKLGPNVERTYRRVASALA